MAKLSKQKDIGIKLDDLARKIADEAQGNISFTDRIEAFKVLTTFYVNTTKVKLKVGEDDDDADTFDSFAKNIHAASTNR